MNIRNITVFETVAREKSISAASKHLYMTPQGISKIIRSLETEYDCELFRRKANGVELTESGKCFLRHIRTIKDAYECMETELSEIRQRDQMTVDLLSAYGVLRLVTPECLTAFREKYPEIELHYREYPDCHVERLFDKREGNIALTISCTEDSKYDITVLESFPIKLLVHRTHPLSLRDYVTIQDLQDEPLYIENRDFRIYHIITDACRQAGFSPNIVFETSGFSLCHKMVKQNKGISLTVDFISDDMKDDDLVLVPFEDVDGRYPYNWDICLLSRKHQTPGKAGRLFSAHVKEWMQGIHEGRIPR